MRSCHRQVGVVIPVLRFSVLEVQVKNYELLAGRNAEQARLGNASIVGAIRCVSPVASLKPCGQAGRLSARHGKTAVFLAASLSAEANAVSAFIENISAK